MKIIKNLNVDAVFNAYPKPIQIKFKFIRQLIIDTASKNKNIKLMEEALKWGEPAYIVKGGSTIRLAWKKSTPNQYAIYFNCKTKLLDAFKERYKNDFKYEGNRAIVFELDDVFSVDALKCCIELALTYHSKKHLPMLGL